MRYACLVYIDPTVAFDGSPESNAILDEAFLCHVGFTVDAQPYVIPTSYGRVADMLYIHGSAASRMLRNLDQGVPVCVTVTHIGTASFI